MDEREQQGMSRWRLLAALGILAAAVIGARVLPLAEWTVRLVEVVRESGARGVALFAVIYVVCTVALIPASVLTMAAGFVYGPLYGLLVVVPAATLGATGAFLLGRTVLRGWVRRRIRSSPRAQALDRAVGREGFTLVFLLRLSPLVPFNVLNYALSLSGISTGRYVLATFLGIIPGTWLYVYLGSLVTEAARLSTSATPHTPLRTVLYATGLAATVIAVVVSGRIAQRALAGAVPPEEAS
jgi:uncharacterized membrane protein YdjX (TVP38/TMEM64 family)